jgi:hypothetical protein
MSGLVSAFQMRVIWQPHGELWCTPGRVRTISACPFACVDTAKVRSRQ